MTEWAWVGDEYKPIHVQALVVDGEKIKANTWYTLKDGKVEEVAEE